MAMVAARNTSGGNSGSPVVNGRGQLVGINFDRVWENVAGDFGFNPALSRNISVDIRYLLWLLAQQPQAEALRNELGVSGK
ncbi:MAG: S46 family peptidase [Candidatus Competibacteraceae bacterium]|nr:S46 family peptidase [Candidatus Competibacteraceae bacterium]